MRPKDRCRAPNQSFVKNAASLKEILDNRERRAERQRELITLYGTPLVSFTMNIPGMVKTGRLIRKGFDLGTRLIEAAVPFSHKEEYESPCGYEALYCVAGDAAEIKRKMADVEASAPCGRLFDIDVIRTAGTKVSRQELGLPARACLLCGNDARMCRRADTHTTGELYLAALSLLHKTFQMPSAGSLPAGTEREKRALPDHAGIAVDACSQYLGETAASALKAELDATPKPGLVDRDGCGSHADMDYGTFLHSITALKPYFTTFARAGLLTADEAPEDTFELIRDIGKGAEKAMFAATGGVNTHKGAVFVLGLAAAAAGRVLATGQIPKKSAAESRPFSGASAAASVKTAAPEQLSGVKPEQADLAEKVLAECARMTAGITGRDFAGITSENAKTIGERLFALCGITGIRGEAEAGFPAVREAGLPYYRQALQSGMNENDAACTALLVILCHTTDTCLIKRGGVSRAAEITAMIRGMLSSDAVSCDVLTDLDRLFVSENLSPGGSADLLSLTIFLFRLAMR